MKAGNTAKRMPVCFAAFSIDGLQFLERVAQVIENVAWQQRFLTLIAIKNCDLSRAPA